MPFANVQAWYMAAIDQENIAIVFPYEESYWLRVVTREESNSILLYLLQKCISRSTRSMEDTRRDEIFIT
jgi:hypothetical protein